MVPGSLLEEGKRAEGKESGNETEPTRLAEEDKKGESRVSDEELDERKWKEAEVWGLGF